MFQYLYSNQTACTKDDLHSGLSVEAFSLQFFSVNSVLLLSINNLNNTIYRDQLSDDTTLNLIQIANHRVAWKLFHHSLRLLFIILSLSLHTLLWFLNNTDGSCST